MNRNRAAILFIGVLVSAPLLALYLFGVFPEAARWISGRLPNLLVLPEGVLRHSLPLQYLFYTVLAFSNAWLGMELEAAWKKYVVGMRDPVAGAAQEAPAVTNILHFCQRTVRLQRMRSSHQFLEPMFKQQKWLVDIKHPGTF